MLNERWEVAKGFLVSQVSSNVTVSELFCVEHQHNVPCQTCMYVDPAHVPYVLLDGQNMVEGLNSKDVKVDYDG